MQVKGTWLSDYVILIRNFIKNNDKGKKQLDEFLTEKDWETINQWILPSLLYPYDFFQRVGTAVYVVIAQENKETTQAFGRIFLKKLIAVYKNLLVKGEVAASLKKFAKFHQAYFKDVESRTYLIESTDKSALMRLQLIKTDKEMRGAAGMAYQLAGSFEEIIEQAGGNKAKVYVEKEPDGNYLFKITWEIQKDPVK